MSIGNFRKSWHRRYFYGVNHHELEQLFLKNFPHRCTDEQSAFFAKLAQFIYSKPHPCFLLTGYAGTGKTTLVRSVVETYKQLNGKVVLLAPTGRASKVLAQRTKHWASTIHRHIYMVRNQGGMHAFSLRPNTYKHALFVVDEASMIADTGSDGSAFGKRSLLDDLLLYISNGHYCKVLFIGDTAQLPPVGLQLSPALDTKVLDLTYHLNPVVHSLKQVIRQAEKSTVLKNATALRNLLASGKTDKPQLLLADDFVRLNDPYEMQEVFESCFGDSAHENGLMIVYSNKRANQYNFDIRARIQYKEELLCSGDQLMVVKNSYFWLKNTSKAGFIANGDTVEVLSLRNEEEMYGYRFVDATIRLLDYPEEEPLDVKIMLDVLQTDGPSLSHKQLSDFFALIEMDYGHIAHQKSRLEVIKNNPYYNALQVKFAHVVTCHKAQGGQWPHVIIEQSWLPDGEVDTSYLRWLYTAITRAQERVYLVGFDHTFFA
jgi:ATP-dependent exoDNAse (exonuclease V) alpha subunit